VRPGADSDQKEYKTDVLISPNSLALLNLRGNNMCDPGPFRNRLIAIIVAIAVAAALVLGAAAANASFWLAWQSPGLMAAAGFATLAAFGLCFVAMYALDSLCACTGQRCTGQCSNVRNTVNAVRVVLGIQALACFGVALYAWIPWFALPSIKAIAGALLIQIALLLSALYFYSKLAECARQIAPPANPNIG